jgi:hypothetical protein
MRSWGASARRRSGLPRPPRHPKVRPARGSRCALTAPSLGGPAAMMRRRPGGRCAHAAVHTQSRRAADDARGRRAAVRREGAAGAAPAGGEEAAAGMGGAPMWHAAAGVGSRLFSEAWAGEGPDGVQCDGRGSQPPADFAPRRAASADRRPRRRRACAPCGRAESLAKGGRLGRSVPMKADSGRRTQGELLQQRVLTPSGAWFGCSVMYAFQHIAPPQGLGSQHPGSTR